VGAEGLGRRSPGHWPTRFSLGFQGEDLQGGTVNEKDLEEFGEEMLFSYLLMLLLMLLLGGG